MTEEKANLFHTITRNILLVGFSIWAFTNLTHTYFSTFFPGLQESIRGLILYPSIVSLVMGLLLSWLWIMEKELKILKIITHSFVIVLMVHTWQAAYASIEEYSLERDGPKKETIPFMSARPWLVPKGMVAAIEKSEDKLQVSRQLYLSDMDSLTSILNDCGIMTDSVFLMVKPEATTVAYGGKYKAEVVLAAKLDSNHVRSMSVNGKPLPFHDGLALYEETTTGSGTKRLDFEAEVRLFGNDITVISNTESYQTVSSFIEVSSQAISSLYRNCGNRLNIQVPALGNNYHPRFAVDGAEFRYGKDRGFITVLPKSERVRIGVFNNGVKIGERSFPVRDVPSPTIKLFVNGNEVDLNKGIIAQTPQIELRAIPDPDFQRAMAQDASYRVTACEVSLVGGNVIRGSLKDYGTAQIAHLMRRAQSGDYLRVEVEQVMRKNFKGDTEEVKSFSPRFFSIPIL